MCFQGYATCAAVGASNGCETNIYRDALNCGACGKVCDAATPFCCGMFGCQVSAAVCKNLNTTLQTSFLPDQVRAPGGGEEGEGALLPSEAVTGVVEGTPTDAGAGDAAAAAAMAGAGDDTSKEDAVAAAADPGLGAVGGSPGGGGAAPGDAFLPVASVEAGASPQSYAVPGGMTAAQAKAARAGAAASLGAAAGGRAAVTPAAGGGAHAAHGAAAAASSGHAGHSQFAPMPGGEAMMAPKASDAVDVPPPGPVEALMAGRP